MFHINSYVLNNQLPINTLTLSKNTFQSNSVDGRGGALFIYTKNTLTLSKNAFQNNSANDSGGAVFAHKNNILNLSQNYLRITLLALEEEPY